MSDRDSASKQSTTSDPVHLWNRPQYRRLLAKIGKGCFVLLFGIVMFFSSRTLSFDLVSCTLDFAGKSGGTGGVAIGAPLCTTIDFQTIAFVGSVGVISIGVFILLQSVAPLLLHNNKQSN